MIKIIEKPAKIKGNEEKKITEFIGQVSTKTEHISIAQVSSPQGWSEPGQTPQFDEYTVVLKGILKIETKEKAYNIKPGQSIIIEKNTWVRYSTPYENGAEYIAVCLPAFTLDLANRDN